MKRSILLSALVLSTAATGVHAAEVEWHPSSVQRTGSPTQAAERHLASSSLRLSGVTLKAVRVLPVGSHATVRFEQEHGGVPVIGGQAAVLVSPAGRIRMAVVDVARGLTVGTVPAVDAKAARAAAASRAGAAAPAGASLAVRDDGRGGRLVWAVDVPTGDGGWRYLVDATSGRVIEEHPLARRALGTVYPISEAVTPNTQDLELVDLDTASPQYLTGWGGNLTVTNYVSGGQMSGYTVEQTVTPNQGADFLYDPPSDPTSATDPFAQVSIYYHLTRMRSFFEGLGLDFSAPTDKLTAVANVQEDGMPMDNAFFSPMGIDGTHASPNMVGIGQGSSFDFAIDSDVFLHELTHYVSHVAVGYNGGQTYTNAYGLHPFAGSIDEGISDYFACTENGDPNLGEASLEVLGGGRDLTDTSKTCPRDVLGEVHEDGEIIGSFSWTLRDMFGADIADELVWGATTLLTMDASLSDFARGVRTTAEVLEGEGTLTATDLADIDAEIAARGLDECDTELPLRKEEPRTANLAGLDVLALAFGGSCAEIKTFGATLQSLYHYVVTPESGDDGVRIAVDLDVQGSGDLDWNILARKDEHVGFVSNGFLPEASDFDYATEGLTSASGELVIDEASDPPFDPNATYHVVVTHQNCPTALATIATDVPGPMGQGGAGGGSSSAGVGGGDAADEGGSTVVHDGCGCRTVGGSSRRSGVAAFLSLALMALSRRRRS